MKLVSYCNSSVLLYQYLTAKFNFSCVSFQRFDLKSLLWYFLSLWSQKRWCISYKFYQTSFVHCAYSNHMLTAAGVWTDCWLEINLFYWARQ